MRPDQYLQLQALSEKLIDVVLHDSDPDNWVGAGKKAADLTKQERGDAYWCRKVAAASLSVTMRTMNLIGLSQGNIPLTTESSDPKESELDNEIAAVEKESEKLLAKLALRKAAFDKRTHGPH